MADETHDAGLRSWVESANTSDTDFPVQNLPFGVFRPLHGDSHWRVGVAIGEMILDVAAALRANLLHGDAARAAATCSSPSLNGLMSVGPSYWRSLRAGLSRLLTEGTPFGGLARTRADEILLAQRDAELRVPAEIGDYTDFYASVHHATNVGSMFRPDNPLLPNYKWVPIGYHGRSSSIVVSGSTVRRPAGQVGSDAATTPTFAPTQRLDYEAEVGFFVGPGNALGETIPIAEAPRHLFGAVLLNDWSARDLQAWEYQPLGPFLAKNFATTVSPWVVTMEALAPFRVPAFRRPEGDPSPLPYLWDDMDQAHGGIATTVEVWLRTARMRAYELPPVRLSAGQLQDMYWTPAQLLAHHASNGCAMQTGDLLGSGTISGATRESRGCLLELTWRGSEPIRLPSGEERRFLEDGDEVVMRGSCRREGYASIGFGECRGTIVGEGRSTERS